MKSRLHQMYGALLEEPGSPAPPLALRALAAGASGLYGLGARGRRSLYDRGWRQAKKLPCPVLSVGNLVAGGTGKTPFTAWLARWYHQAGCRVAILSRGYGGRASGINVISDGRRILLKPPQAGDEASWLALKLPGVPVVTGSDRYTAGLRAWQAFRPDLILLDDGFQHFQLHRDLDVVLLDAARPFGNGRLLPRGPLREPKDTLRRPLVLVLTRYEENRDRQTYEALGAQFPEALIVRASFRLSQVVASPGRQAVALQDLADKKLAALAGLARPEVFAASLQEHGLTIKKYFIFPDHHSFTREEVAALVAQVRRLGLDGVLTTEKDLVKLDRNWFENLHLFVVSLEVHLLDPWPENLLPLPCAKSGPGDPILPAGAYL